MSLHCFFAVPLQANSLEESVVIPSRCRLVLTQVAITLPGFQKFCEVANTEGQKRQNSRVTLSVIDEKHKRYALATLDPQNGLYFQRLNHIFSGLSVRLVLEGSSCKACNELEAHLTGYYERDMTDDSIISSEYSDS